MDLERHRTSPGRVSLGVFPQTDVPAGIFGKAQHFPQPFAMVRITLGDWSDRVAAGFGDVDQGVCIALGADHDLGKAIVFHIEERIGMQDAGRRQVNQVIL